MIFGALPLAEAEGAVLAHAVTLDGRRVAKGTPVNRALVEAAQAAGIERLWVARAEPGDIPEAEAAARIGAALAGPGAEARAPVHGRVNLHARAAGLFLCDPAGIRAANAAGEAVAISTLPPFTPVAAGQMLATVKLIPFAVSEAALAAAMPAAPVEVRPWRAELRATFLATIREDVTDKALAKSRAVTEGRLAALGLGLQVLPPVPHAVAPLAEALRQAAAGSALVLVSGATATSDPRDVVPEAILAAGGTVERVGMPVDPGNLLVLGRIEAAAVLGLPGCARSPKRNGLDLVLERLVAGLPVSSDDIAAMGVGGLLEEAGQPVPWAWTG